MPPTRFSYVSVKVTWIPDFSEEFLKVFSVPFCPCGPSFSPGKACLVTHPPHTPCSECLQHHILGCSPTPLGSELFCRVMLLGVAYLTLCGLLSRCQQARCWWAGRLEREEKRVCGFGGPAHLTPGLGRQKEPSTHVTEAFSSEPFCSGCRVRVSGCASLRPICGMTATSMAAGSFPPPVTSRCTSWEKGPQVAAFLEAETVQ